ncbi:hypothetical protein V6N12_035436 [Hibiscus sabdariffa]|uniref:Uncharacterized protein n=1 Tax=Hibiscus sabdariffa TaxID=183260 RepID=A0ABR2EN15_9ROSI
MIPEVVIEGLSPELLKDIFRVEGSGDTKGYGMELALAITYHENCRATNPWPWAHQFTRLRRRGSMATKYVGLHNHITLTVGRGGAGQNFHLKGEEYGS